MTTATEVKPVKGMVFEHATRKNYDGSPVQGTVTSVMHGKVYWAHPLYQGGKRFKTPLESFASKWCARVISTPEPYAANPVASFTDAQVAALVKKAHEAGMAAGEAAVPAPMIVGSPTTPLGSDIDPEKKVYFVEGGICGLAYVTVKGNTPFGRKVKKVARFRASYYGGLEMPVWPFGQSLTRKAAYAAAYAAVLREAGVSDASSRTWVD